MHLHLRACPWQPLLVQAEEVPASHGTGPCHCQASGALAQQAHRRQAPGRETEVLLLKGDTETREVRAPSERDRTPGGPEPRGAMQTHACKPLATALFLNQLVQTFLYVPIRDSLVTGLSVHCH